MSLLPLPSQSFSFYAEERREQGSRNIKKCLPLCFSFLPPVIPREREQKNVLIFFSQWALWRKTVENPHYNCSTQRLYSCIWPLFISMPATLAELTWSVSGCVMLKYVSRYFDGLNRSRKLAFFPGFFHNKVFFQAQFVCLFACLNFKNTQKSTSEWLKQIIYDFPSSFLASPLQMQSKRQFKDLC